MLDFSNALRSFAAPEEAISVTPISNGGSQVFRHFDLLSPPLKA
jgi:hypothetical protein